MDAIATRRERVVLELEDNFSTGMARAAAATALLNRELNSLSGSAVRTASRDMDRASKDIDKTGTSAERTGKQIDRLSGRLALLAQAAAVLGPALVPLGAAALPAVAGLTAEVGALAGALGVTLLAFKGLGDGIKALNTYQLEPTAANLEKVREEFEKLGPAGAHFVKFLDDLGPQLSSIQDAAREGLFPGIEDGITELLPLLPQVRSLVSEIATAMGDLATDAGASLAGPKWRAFFDYLERTAAPTLTSLGHIVGDFAAGLANLLVAFEPLSNAFTLGLEDMAASFESWSSTLDTNQGFQDFLGYLEQAGPKALDFLGALVGALASIVEAAAPVGDAVLPALTALANVLSTLAQSPVGPMFFTAAAALSVYSRATAVAASAQARFGGSLAGTVRGLTAVTTAQERALLSAQQLTRVQSGQRSAWAGAAAQIGALAFVASGAADSMGLANTATLGLMGSLAGPWGVALGTATGLVMDFTKGTADAGDQLDTWNGLLRQNQTDLTAYAQTVASAEAQLRDLSSAVPTDFFDQMTKALNPENIKMNLQGLASVLDRTGISGSLFGSLDDSALAKQIEIANELRSKYDDLTVAATGLGQAMDMVGAGQSAEEMGVLNDVLERAKPAMDALGISVEDLAAGVRDGSITTLIAQIVEWNRQADSTKGRTKAVADAIADLGSDALTTAQSATQLSQALDALLSPQLNLSQATDQWRAGLRNLTDELDGTSRSLTAQTDAGDKNRAAVRGQVTNLTALMNAQAEAGAGSGKLSKTMRDGRKAIMDAGVAAGFSRKEMRDYLDTLGLTPELVQTIIKAQTGEALSALDTLAARLRAMDGKTATTYVRTVYQHIGKSTQFGGADGDPSTPYWSGGYTGPGGKYEPAGIVHRGEVVIPQDRVRRDWPMLKARYGDLPGFAAGGVVGGVKPQGTLEDQLAIAQIMQQIRDLQRDLRRDGKDKLEGLDRRIAELQLRLAEKELRLAEHREQREARQEAREALREKRQGLRSAAEGLSFDGLVPQEPQTVAQGVRAEINAFRDQIHEAGGVWSKELRQWARDMMATAREYDATQAAIEAETERRERLVETLNEQQSQLDDLNRTMEAFGAQVAANFLTDPFNQSRTVTVSGDPAAVAALAQAQAQLAAVQASGGPGAAAQASRLMQQIALLQGPASPTEQTLTGLDALRNVLTTDTANAQAFAAALQQAVTRGLDPTGGLFQQLATSGDLTTAQQLAGLSPAEIDQFEAMFKAREDAAAQLAALTTQAVYGEQQAQLQALVESTQAAIRASDATLTVLNAQLVVLGAQVQAGAEQGVEALRPQFEAINATLATIPGATARELQHLIRKLAGK